jgi:hypothetical protein
MRHIFFVVHGRALKVQDLFVSIEFSEEIVMAVKLENRLTLS